MTRDEAEEFTQALGQVFGGGWRLILHAQREGIPDALGLSVPEWVETRLGGYVRLSLSERREAAKELTSPPEDGGHGMTHREAADVLGVSHPTITRDVNPPAGTNEPAEPFDEWPDLPEDEEPGSFEPPEEQAKTTRDLLAQSDENEWYTPRRFTAAAATVLGGIDLDPASSEAANEIVGAGRYYTIHDNGLNQPWKGTVWLNPPYGGENRLFVERLIREYEAGNVTAAVTLINCHPAETAWFQRLFDYTICFVRGRIDFTGPARDRASTSTHGSACAYLGPDWQAFAAEFSRFGAVVRRV